MEKMKEYWFEKISDSEYYNEDGWRIELHEINGGFAYWADSDSPWYGECDLVRVGKIVRTENIYSPPMLVVQEEFTLNFANKPLHQFVVNESEGLLERQSQMHFARIAKNESESLGTSVTLTA